MIVHKFGGTSVGDAQCFASISVSFCIPQDQVADTVRFLHRELGFEDEAETRPWTTGT